MAHQSGDGTRSGFVDQSNPHHYKQRAKTTKHKMMSLRTASRAPAFIACRTFPRMANASESVQSWMIPFNIYTSAPVGYRHAIVIDSLGSPGTAFSEGLTPLSPDELHDVCASGLTAVNLTVNGSPGSYARDYDETVRQIAYWNAEIAAHPNIFLQVLRTVDIAEAKRSGRLGIIYRFQDATPIAEDLNRVDTFRNLGVRIFQLTYNRRNLVGDGCLESG